MYEGLRQIDYKLVGWGWMLWDFNWFRRRTADSTVARVAARASAGDIVVMHDGDESAPRQGPAADGRRDRAAGSGAAGPRLQFRQGVRERKLRHGVGVALH